MVWNAKGDERARSYKLYQKLEYDYNQAMGRIRELEQELQGTRETIRNLARELGALPRPPETIPEDGSDRPYQAAVEPARPVSGMRQVEMPGVIKTRPAERITAPLNQVLASGNLPAAKKGAPEG